MDITHNDIQSILKIIDAAEHLDEIEIVPGDFRLHVVRNGNGGLREAPQKTVAVTQPAAMTAVAAKPTAEPVKVEVRTAAEIVPDDVVAIRAPMLGVFYRAPSPGEKPFVEVGQRVCADDTVALLEVMKLFNSIRAGLDGEVVKILVDNGTMVEFDQALIFLKPGRT
jgi:acetyl-CoA carboxylase biotin carboxyl carrier protein